MFAFSGNRSELRANTLEMGGWASKFIIKEFGQKNADKNEKIRLFCYEERKDFSVRRDSYIVSHPTNTNPVCPFRGILPQEEGRAGADDRP